MDQPTAVIAEDEPLLRSELRDNLRKLWPELIICAEVADGIEAVRAMNEFLPQVMFLDVQMPGLTGLEVAAQAGGRAHIVFLTAHDSHAMAAFEQGVLDYVPKPISIARLSKAIDRLRQRLRSQPPTIGLPGPAGTGAAREGDYLKWLTVPYGQELRLVTADEICYLRADNKYTSVLTYSGEFLLTSALKSIRDRLDPKTFWQIHRSYIVNVAAIHSVHRSFRGALEIKLKQRTELLPVSNAYTHLFKHL